MVQVSIIMPCFNEEDFISQAITSLVDEYVMQYSEILVIDGLSTDNTEKIVEDLIGKKFPIKIIQNKKRLQCFGLNQGIRSAKGEFIVRVDAHSIYPKGYIKRLVELLKKSDAVNVGGIMLPKGNTSIQKAIALAMQHPVGVGDAKFHLGNYKGYVDTVYLGAFRKKIFDVIGLYDTHCRTNEDAELNIRILKAGEKIYLDSSIQVEYLPRDSFWKLAVQYFHYGRGRAYTTIKHRHFTSYRQVAPPILVIALLFTLLLSFFVPFALIFWGFYLAAVLGSGLFTWSHKKISLKIRLLMTISFFIMHTCWGKGFISYFLYPISLQFKKISK